MRRRMNHMSSYPRREVKSRRRGVVQRTIGAAISGLFESPSAHAVLLRVFHESGGLAGAILTDTVVKVRDLAASERLLAIDWDWVRADDEAHFLDRLAEQVVRQAGGARSRT
jgi:hypothetical protein